MVVTITLSPATEAHHWIWFVHCGFDDVKPNGVVNTALAPTYGRLALRTQHIEFIREYKTQRGLECTSIHLVSGTWVLVAGSLDNIAKRLETKLKIIDDNNKENK